jgi:xanthine dehydrogenase accessory factor
MRSDLSLDRIREIRSPIGLDIKARTPEEIAISIMSEILMFRLGGSGLPMKLDEKQLDRINKKISEEDSKSKVTPIEAV